MKTICSGWKNILCLLPFLILKSSFLIYSQEVLSFTLNVKERSFASASGTPPPVYDRVIIDNPQGITWLRITGKPADVVWEAGDDVIFDGVPIANQVIIVPKGPPPCTGCSSKHVSILYFYAWGNGILNCRLVEIPYSDNLPLEGDFIRNVDGSLGGSGNLIITPQNVQAGNTVNIRVEIPERMRRHIRQVDITIPDPGPDNDIQRTRVLASLPYEPSGVYATSWTIPAEPYGRSNYFGGSAMIRFDAYSNKPDENGRFYVVTWAKGSVGLSGLLSLHLYDQSKEVPANGISYWDLTKERKVGARVFYGKEPYKFSYFINDKKVEPNTDRYDITSYKDQNMLNGNVRLTVTVNDANGNTVTSSIEIRMPAADTTRLPHSDTTKTVKPPVTLTPAGPPPVPPIKTGDPSLSPNPDIDWNGKPWLDSRVQTCIREYLQLVLRVSNEKRKWENTGRSPLAQEPLFNSIDDWGRLLSNNITTGGSKVDGNWENSFHYVWYAYNKPEAESLYGRTVEYFVKYECSATKYQAPVIKPVEISSSCSPGPNDKQIWSGQVNATGQPTEPIQLVKGFTYYFTVKGTINSGTVNGKSLLNDACFEYNSQGIPVDVGTLRNNLDITVCDNKYHTDHIYCSGKFESKGQAINFWIFDTDYSGNSGSLLLNIYTVTKKMNIDEVMNDLKQENKSDTCNMGIVNNSNSVLTSGNVKSLDYFEKFNDYFEKINKEIRDQRANPATNELIAYCYVAATNQSDLHSMNLKGVQSAAETLISLSAFCPDINLVKTLADISEVEGRQSIMDKNLKDIRNKLESYGSDIAEIIKTGQQFAQNNADPQFVQDGGLGVEILGDGYDNLGSGLQDEIATASQRGNVLIIVFDAGDVKDDIFSLSVSGRGNLGETPAGGRRTYSLNLPAGNYSLALKGILTTAGGCTYGILLVINGVQGQPIVGTINMGQDFPYNFSVK
jgi:hypothetical protein